MFKICRNVIGVNWTDLSLPSDALTTSKFARHGRRNASGRHFVTTCVVYYVAARCSFSSSRVARRILVANIMIHILTGYSGGLAREGGNETEPAGPKYGGVWGMGEREHGCCLIGRSEVTSSSRFRKGDDCY